MLEQLDYKALGFWLQLGQAFLTLALFVYAWVTTRQKANTASIDKMKTDFSRDLNNIDDRLIRVERDLEHLPKHKDMAALHKRVNETNESVKNMSGQLTQIDHTMKLINRFLIEKG